jgi:hypothetical protein
MATLADFRIRYPAFAAVPDATASYWLDEGVLTVAAWRETDQERGSLAYAAHRLAEQGMGEGAIAQGVTSFKSGTFSASISDSAAMRTGFGATIYGREFLDLARRNFAGPRVVVMPGVAGL